MSRHAMEQAISQIPTQIEVLAQTRPYLLEVGDQLQDNILGILTAMAGPEAYVFLVVTPSEIIGVSSDGSRNVWRYRHVKEVLFAGGKRTLLGRHYPSYLNIILPDGNAVEFYLIDHYEYMSQIGMRAETACRMAQSSDPF